MAEKVNYCVFGCGNENNPTNIENIKKLRILSEKVAENTQSLNEIKNVLDKWKFGFSSEAISALAREKKFKKETIRLIPLEADNKKYGYINEDTLTWEIEPIFKYAFKFYNGYAMVKLDIYNSDNFVTIINTKGEVICHWEKDKSNYWHCGEVSEGFIKVGKELKDPIEFFKDVYGYFNIFNYFQIEPQFTRCEDFRNGIAVVEVHNRMKGIINTQGEYIFKSGPNTTIDRDYSNCIFGELIFVSKNRSIGLMTIEGKWAIEPQFDNLYKKNNLNTDYILDGKIGEKWYKIDYYLNITPAE